MKQIKFSSLLVLFLSIALFVGCTKETEEDPADKFVGSYNYNITVTGMTNPLSGSGTFSISKNKSDKIYVFNDGSLTNYTVVGSTITEDAGQTYDLPISGGGTASFVENSTGTLAGNVLTINGTWSKSGYNPIIFKIVATKK